IQAWCAGDDEGWERTKDVRHHEVGQWLARLLEEFQGDEAVSQSEPYRLLARLLDEHGKAFGYEPHEQDEADGRDDDDGATPASAAGTSVRASSSTIRKPRRNKRRAKTRRKKPGKARYWSPHDPDASMGHKGLGYHVHVAETCP